MRLVVLFGLLLAGLSGCSSPSEVDSTRIRIRNATHVPFENVIVGDKSYGDIAPGDVTEYQTWRHAYRYAYVSLKADGKPMLIQPIDYMGETPLGDGRFTYVLTIEGGHLQIHVD